MQQIHKSRIRIMVAVVVFVLLGIGSISAVQYVIHQTSDKTSTTETIAVESTYESEQETSGFYSELAAEDCMLCGTGTGSLLPVYQGQDNVGIVSLNTFTISCVEINPYDDYGKPKKPDRGSATHIRGSGNGGYFSAISEDQGRGYAHGSISLNQDRWIDLEKAATFLCSDCLNSIMDECWEEEPYGVGVIDFKTKEIRLFEYNVTAFIFNDYYISCKTRNRDAEESEKEIELLIFYCPERY